MEANLVEDLEIAAPENIAFECGDNVVYPHHGAGKVLKKERRKMFGEARNHPPKKTPHNDMPVRAPGETPGVGGRRGVIEGETAKKAPVVRADDVGEMQKNGTRRFKHNRD